ncbi:MarR family transcriptional regulator [Streptomyces piniterrae]|uniref:MarR family transcriptional regulator n=1 Tax=Streptomyces piniterrae TaxID=2571125 RepID=A0A4U0NJT6_9ACTN|nr:transcriptional regulator [Streptomyces piniterrae]TJZ54575.1 MarR family transcriptional regulator [Streptomyces piniterrae]
MSEPAFDEVLHPANRLRICAMLAAADSVAFSTIQEALGISDSVLSKQVKILQQSGYLAVAKKTSNSRARTWLSLTPTGRKALAGHLAELRRIAELAGPAPE